jgi:hypothetical protein
LRVQKADEVRKQMSDCRHMARDCIVQHKSVIAAITRNTDTLKPANDAQSAAIDAARRTLRQERAKRNEKLASCKLVLANNDALTSDLDRLQEQMLTKRLTVRSLNTFSSLIDSDRQLDWVAALAILSLKQSGFP